MRIDARKVPAGTNISADLCIIGGGAAGITVARELAGSAFRVCLLEAGGFQPDSKTQELYDLATIGHQYSTFARLRYLGGCTNHWGGHCVPMRAINFEKLPWSRYSGWPFGLDLLRPYYQRAHDQLQLGPLDYDAAKVAKDLGLDLFPFDSSRVESVVSRYRPVRFGTAYRDDLLNAGNITLYTHSNVVSINRAADGDYIESVSVKTITGTPFTVRAKRYVLATGGIENARILLASNGTQREGLGNQNDLVGRFFMEHIYYPSGAIVPVAEGVPLVAYGKQAPKDSDLRFRFHVALPEQVVREHAIPDFRSEIEIIQTERYADSVMSLAALRNSLREAELPDGLVDHIRNIASEPGAIVRYLRSPQEGPTVYRLQNYFEQAPNPESRIALSKERDFLGMPKTTVDWKLSETDREGIRKAHSLIAAEVGRSGFGRMKIELDPNETELLADADGGYHHMGTTRMHTDPKQGVVDPNCQIHGLKNAYIAGSSVFPTVGYVNPTLTIVALAIRLADHLKKGASNAT